VVATTPSDKTDVADKVVVIVLGNPMVKVWPDALVSISSAVPAMVKFCESKSTAPLPVSPKKSKSCAVPGYLHKP